jgi:hypothetical protein
VKHGQGKIVFAGVEGVGAEEYEGEWIDDEMNGQGTYKYSSGNIYSGSWKDGEMHGFGKMVYSDGSQYEGQWAHNLMHGEGVYLDADGITWSGIFVNGEFDSKIQKKLRAEKEIQDKVAAFSHGAKSYFLKFDEVFSQSDKKTFKDNLSPFFGSAEQLSEFL